MPINKQNRRWIRRRSKYGIEQQNPGEEYSAARMNSNTASIVVFTSESGPGRQETVIYCIAQMHLIVISLRPLSSPMRRHNDGRGRKKETFGKWFIIVRRAAIWRICCLIRYAVLDKSEQMSSAFVELLRKSNLDYLVVRKPFKVGSRSDDIVFGSLIDVKTKKLQVSIDETDVQTSYTGDLLLPVDRVSG